MSALPQRSSTTRNSLRVTSPSNCKTQEIKPTEGDVCMRVRRSQLNDTTT
jgi:hypothetical protein